MDWFRFYSEVVRDPKVQRLPGSTFKHWVNILCLASDNDPRGCVPSVKDISFHLRLSEGKASFVLRELIRSGLVDEVDGRYEMHGWERRQFVSDNVTERVRKHRRNVSETPPDTEQIQRQNRTESEDRSNRVRVDDPIDQIAADFATFGLVTAGTPQAIEYAIEEHGQEWTASAVRKAAGAGFEGQPPWSFVESILMRWKKAGQPDEGQVFERTPVGRNATGTQAPVDALAIYASMGIRAEDLPVRLPVRRGEASGLAALDGHDDQAGLARG